MLKLLKSLLRNNTAPEAISQQPSAQVEARAQTPAPSTDQKTINPMMLGLKVGGLSGWYGKDNGELYHGFVIDASDTVLDVGCGDGGKLDYCAKRGAHIIFTDADQQRVKQTEKRLGNTAARLIEGMVSDSNPLPLKNETASKIISTEVIEHVDDPVQFMSELVRVGKPNAQYLLSAPHPIAENLQKGFAHPSYFEKPNHIRIISEESFKKLVTDAGLTIESHTQYGSFWSIWWLFYWLCEEQDLKAPWHPLLDNWTKTWDELLKTPEGPRVQKALDELIPKSQVIIARKN